jgi:acyl-CoA thioesterase-1
MELKTILYHTDGLRYLALGDSYTIAEGEEYTQSYPSLLVKALQQSGLVFEKQTTLAVTGWRTDQLLEAVDRQQWPEKYDLVSLLIGVNNQYQSRSLDEYRTEFERLLQKAIGLAGGKVQKVFVLSIPDYGVTPFAGPAGKEKSASLEEFNKAAAALCRNYGVLFLDITPISRYAESDSELLVADLLHPSGKMYALWVEHIYPAVRSLLAN